MPYRIVLELSTGTVLGDACLGYDDTVRELREVAGAHAFCLVTGRTYDLDALEHLAGRPKD